MKSVPLTRGKFAIVDDEDFERVSAFNWQYWHSGNLEYACRTIRIGGRRVTLKMHRFIIPHDLPHTDHINHNGLDNRKANLRPCTRAQNGGNRFIQKHSSKFKGVSFFPLTGKWTSSIRINKKKRHLGYFSNERDAAAVYDQHAKRVFGDFAKTNEEMGLL